MREILKNAENKLQKMNGNSPYTKESFLNSGVEIPAHLREQISLLKDDEFFSFAMSMRIDYSITKHSELK